MQVRITASQNITICQRLSEFTFVSLGQAVALRWSALKWDPDDAALYPSHVLTHGTGDSLHRRR